ncbi:MAG: hypothetical protein ACREL7_03990 [Longimicrobiales bacterium]
MTAEKSPNRLRISIVDLTFIIWVLVIPIAFGSRLLNVDGDLPRHLTMGEFVLEGGLDGIDTFAYTKTGPYEGMEWLSQVVFALVHRAGGLAAVAILAGIVIATAIALVVLVMRRAGVHPLLAYLAGTLAAVGASVHWVPRPHIFTFAFLPLLLLLLESSLPRRRMWVFVPFFALWANLHGMFILGLAMLGVWSAGALVEAWRATGEDRRNWLGRAEYGGVAIGLGIAGALINPHFWRVFAGVTSCLGDGFIFQNTAEFQSLSFQSLYGRLVLIGLLAIMALLAINRERLSLPRLFLVLFMLAGGLTSVRMMPLFALVGVPLLAIEFDGMWRRLNPGRRLADARQVFEAGESIARPGWYAPLFAVLMLALVPVRGNVGGVQLVPDRFDPEFFPVEAVAYARSNDVQGRIFNEFIWGGYLLYAWPEQRIFIDGMTCFLGSEVMRSYMKILSLDPGWQEDMQRWGMTLVLVEPDTRLPAALLDSGDWAVLHEDETAILLERQKAWDVAVMTPDDRTVLGTGEAAQ